MPKYQYQGNGFIQGLPARDMTAAEWKTYDTQLTKTALKAGLYIKVSEVKHGTD